MVVITPKPPQKLPPKPEPSRLEQIRGFASGVAKDFVSATKKLPERILGLHADEPSSSGVSGSFGEPRKSSGVSGTFGETKVGPVKEQQLDFPDKQQQAAEATQLVSFLGETFPLLEETDSAYIVLRDKGDGILSRYRISKKNSQLVDSETAISQSITEELENLQGIIDRGEPLSISQLQRRSVLITIVSKIGDLLTTGGMPGVIAGKKISDMKPEELQKFILTQSATILGGLVGIAVLAKPIILGGVITGAANTKTAALSAGAIAGSVGAVGGTALTASVVGAIIGTYPWAEWALGEAQEGMIFNARKAMETGDPELIREYMKVMDEIFDIELWENMARMTPAANIAFAFGQKAKALQAQMKVNNRIMEIELESKRLGETEEQKWTRVRQAEADEKKAAVDYYNQQRRLQVQWEREASRDKREDEARFWRKERELEREREAQEREDIAQFWMDYRRTKYKMELEHRSNLGFGIGKSTGGLF